MLWASVWRDHLSLAFGKARFLLDAQLIVAVGAADALLIAAAVLVVLGVV